MPKPRISPSLKRWALSILGALLVLGLAAWLLVPRWLAGPGARMISQSLGREFSIGEVQFRPWSLGLELRNVRIAGLQPKDPPLLSIARVETALSLRSIRHASLVLSSLLVDQPVLRLSRVSEGHYDIDDLLARFSQPAAEPQSGKPPGFGLYNIRISRGQVLLDDRPADRRHELSELQLDLPFLSTLDADVELAVQPRLNGKLNGVAFGGDADLLPFDPRRKASLDVDLHSLDLAPYIPYLPDGLPLRLQRGHVDARLTLRVTQAPKQAPVMALSGEFGLTDFALATPAGQPWLAWRELRVTLKDVRPLHQQVHLGTVSWTGPELALSRDAGGRLWLPGMPASQAAPAATDRPASWAFSLDKFELKQAALDWHDRSTPSPAALRATDIQASIGPLAWPLNRPVPLSYGLRLQAAGDGKSPPASLQGEGSLSADALQLSSRWQDLALASMAPYLQAQAPARLEGLFSGAALLRVLTPLEPEPLPRTTVELQGLRVANLAVEPLKPAQPVLSASALLLDALKLDLGNRQIEVGELGLQQPVFHAVRSSDGRWRHEALLPVPPPAPLPQAGGTASASAAPPWRMTLRSLKLDQGSVRLEDAQAADSAGQGAVQASQIQLRLRNLSWPAGPEPIPASLSLALGRPRGKDAVFGQLRWQGQVLLAPLGARGRLQAERLPLQWLDPYLDRAWGLQVRRAELGLKGTFALSQKAEGLEASWRGDASLAQLRVNQASWVGGERVIGAELLHWASLDLTGLSVAAKPQAPPQVKVDLARLDDYYMRLNVDEKGRFNISDLGPHADGAAAPVPASAAAAAPAPASAPALMLSVGRTQLSKGQIDFSDHFIRPNYSARLSSLEGSLGAFATAKPAMAPLSLRGKIEGTGDLTIEGQMNPAGAPLTMDIKAHASDIELSPLSPYAAKYAGYAIERGKLSTQVQYKIDASGLLQASNKIRLDQLTFGERVDSPDATTLPVLLAVALLKDSDGVIDVDLPVSGSINDPDFSIGGLVFRLIGNLLAKALTAPFSLFSGGGQADVNHLAFAPGSTAPLAPEQLEPLVKMLSQRPALALTITGWADAALDGPALQQLEAEAAAEAERRREQRRQQRGAGKGAATDNKPKGTPPAASPVGEAQLQELAAARATAIRDALLAKGIANSRLFLGSARLTEAASAEWQPHVDIVLDAQ